MSSIIPSSGHIQHQHPIRPGPPLAKAVEAAPTLQLPSGVTRTAKQEKTGGLIGFFKKIIRGITGQSETTRPQTSSIQQHDNLIVQHHQRQMGLEGKGKTVIQTDQPENIASFIDKAALAIQSTSGRNGGVVFLQSPAAAGRKVIKFVDNPDKVVAAERFYQCFSIRTPKSTSHTRSSPIGLATQKLMDNQFAASPELRQKIEEAKADPTKKASYLLNVQSWGNDAEKVHAQVELKSHVLTMDCLDATNWKETDPDNKIAMIMEPQFGKDVGKMLLLDRLLGYEDRIADQSTFNPGNLMVCKDGKLALVDNEMNLSRVDQRDLHKLITNKTYPSHLYGHITGPYGEHGAFGSMDNAKIAILDKFDDNVQEGIRSAAMQLVEECSTDSKTEQFCERLGLSREETVIMKESVSTLKAALTQPKE